MYHSIQYSDSVKRGAYFDIAFGSTLVIILHVDFFWNTKKNIKNLSFLKSNRSEAKISSVKYFIQK